MAIDIERTNISGPRQNRIHNDPETYANGTLMSVVFKQLSGSGSLIFTLQIVDEIRSFPRKFTRWKTLQEFTVSPDSDAQSAFTKFAMSGIADAAEGVVLRVKVRRHEETVEDHMYSIKISGR